MTKYEFTGLLRDISRLQDKLYDVDNPDYISNELERKHKFFDLGGMKLKRDDYINMSMGGDFVNKIIVSKDVKKVKVHKMPYGWRIVLADKQDSSWAVIELEKENYEVSKQRM